MGSDDTPSGPLPEKESVVIWTLSDVVEAELAQDALSEAGIDFVVEPYNDLFWLGAMPIPVLPREWGRVRVAQEDRGRAEAVLAGALVSPH